MATVVQASARLYGARAGGGRAGGGARVAAAGRAGGASAWGNEAMSTSVGSAASPCARRDGHDDNLANRANDAVADYRILLDWDERGDGWDHWVAIEDNWNGQHRLTLGLQIDQPAAASSRIS